MPKKQNLKLSIPLPEGVPLTKELEAQALAAIKEVFIDLEETAAIAKKLEEQGYEIGVAELLQSKKSSAKKTTAKKAAAKKTAVQGKGKRVVLSAVQKKRVIELLKEGKTAREVAEKYGASAATINNLKREAGLTKPSKAQEKIFAERKKALAKKATAAKKEASDRKS